MAGFYDLCVGYDGLTEQARREVVSMAMQLGYSGIALNHVVGGMLSDHDRCKIRPVDPYALENAGAGIAETAKFHRQLLGLPPGSEFRQYSRVTVVLDDSSVTAVINSSPALRSYDLVAVQPTTLKAFGQACQQLEVDIISVDFDQRLPFRMKLPLVKSAIERGIFFEIVYNGALFDLKARIEIFANSQMLQGWTHGKNLILSSGASRGLELRGPNDVANLSTLFGLSPENAKAAVSKHCRSAILHGVTRRKSFKGAISVERCQPDGNLGSDQLLFDIPKIWDPLASVLTETLKASAVLASSSEVNVGHSLDATVYPLEPSPGNSWRHAIEGPEPEQELDALAEAEDEAQVESNKTAVVTDDEPVTFLDTCRNLCQTSGASFTTLEVSPHSPGQAFVTPVKRKSFDGDHNVQNLQAGDLFNFHAGTKSGKRKESGRKRMTGDQNRKKQKTGKKTWKKTNQKRKP